MDVRSPGAWRLLPRSLAAPLACGAIGVTRGQALTAAETQVKAAFVYNVAKFVEWPPASFASPAAPLRLCVAGRGPLPNLLVELDGRSVQGCELRVQFVGNTFDPAACHMVFVAASAEAPFRDMMKKLKLSTLSWAPLFAAMILALAVFAANQVIVLRTTGSLHQRGASTSLTAYRKRWAPKNANH